jgi:alpha-galactosidase
VARIAFVGAGSVEFTKTLISDLLAYPELTELEFVLHDVDERRLDAARAMTHYVNGARGASTRTPRPRRQRPARIGGRDLRHLR